MRSCISPCATGRDGQRNLGTVRDDAHEVTQLLSNRVIAPDGKVVFAYDNLSADDHVNQTMAALKSWRAKNPKR